MTSRNAPCPCGSGRKYKLCCLPRIEQEDRDNAASEEAELERWLEEDFRLGERMLQDAEWNRRFPNGATLGEIHELPDGSTVVPLVAKEA